MTYNNIPLELQQTPQWINWKEALTDDGKPTKLPLRSATGRRASVTNPLDWTDFETAKAAAQHNNVGLGFVFTHSDEFCGTDLDKCLSTNTGTLGIVDFLNSYTEISPSGTGLHIIARGRLPGIGRRRNSIEIYDNARFFTFTGNVYRDAPIAERQAQLLEIYNHISPPISVINNDGSRAQTLSDLDVIDRASAAENGAKFRRLWEGDWQTDYGHQSQSEADFALINMLCFYSHNAEQVTRLFKTCPLGRRQKANRSAYITGMVKRSFDRQQPIVIIPTEQQPSATWFDVTKFEPWSPRLTAQQQAPSEISLLDRYRPDAPLPPSEPPASPPAPRAAQTGGIPGLVGRLYAQCMASAVYQVPEVALASAITSMSLLCGRTYKLGSSGLAMYVLLLSKTSTGKSFAYQAQDDWFNAVLKTYDTPSKGETNLKQRREFLEGMVTGKIGSGPGLAQQMLRSPSTLCQLDEFVTTIKRFGANNPNANDLALKEELLSLIDKAKPGAVFRGKTYSTRGSRDPYKAEGVKSACLTILATGTPEKFYMDINSDLFEDGFIPRFTVLEYEGLLPTKNYQPFSVLDQSLVNEIRYHCNRMYDLHVAADGDAESMCNVTPDVNAANQLSAWSDYCDNRVRDAQKNGLPVAGIWSRANLHVAQIAALIAIGVNPMIPIIADEHVHIAIDIVRPWIDKICAKNISGEMGSGDERLEAEITKYIGRCKSEGWAFYGKNGTPSELLFNQGLLQISIMKNYCIKLSVFRHHKLGGIRAFTDTLNSMIRDNSFARVSVKNANGLVVECIQLH